MHEVTVKARASFKHSVVVEQAGTELVWNFHTAGKNISFGLFKKPASDVQPGLALTGLTDPPPSKRASLVAPSGSSMADTLASTSMLRPRDAAGASSTTSSTDSLNEATDHPRRTTRKSTTAIDPDLIEILPITHYDSSKYTVKGGHMVTEPGVYVLIFDNTFSVNTSKKLTFFVALKEGEKLVSTGADQGRSAEGWILKKGNRRLQGFSKRWMQIETGGVLKYAKQPGSEERAAVDLTNASIRLDHDHLLIDIDSGENLLHFKALSKPDFLMWITAIQHHAEVPRNSVMQTEEETSQELQQFVESHLAQILAEIFQVKQTIETSLQKADGLQSSDFLSALRTLDERSTSILNKVNQIKSRTVDLRASETSRQTQMNQLSATLKQTDAALQACWADNNRIRQQFGLEHASIAQFFMNAAIVTPPAATVTPVLPFRAHTTSAPSYRKSVAGSVSHTDVFYDAEEGEMSIDESDEIDEYEELDATEDSSLNVTPVMSPKAARSHSHGSLGPKMVGYSPMINHAIVMPADQLVASPLAVPAQLPNIPEIKPQDLANNELEKPLAPEPIDPLPELKQPPMKRRAALPAPQVSMENISLMSILRKNIGKDLSTVAMPIALNEPLNLLQKLCEELEYSELLEQAAETSDDVHRIALISAFAISAYGSTILRAGRKPFNPLLGETYECVREDKGFRFISEKVSHHPHIMACHAESRRYVFYQSNQVKTKFWGKSMELIPLGQVNVEFPALGEHYQWNKVTTCMRNILAGTRYLEHYGIMNIKSLKTGYTCQVTFKESGYFTSSKNEVTGVILDPNGQEILSIGGKWDDSIAKFHSSTPNQLEVLWRRRPNPNHSQEMYGFTDYAVQLNELHPSLEGVIPKTDSRYRTDQRMYENGLADESEMEKLRLEALQREYIKELEAQGQKWTPRFFEPVHTEAAASTGSVDVGAGVGVGAGATDTQGRESTASAASPTNSTDRVWRYLPGSYWEQRGRFKDEDQARDLWGQSEP